MMKRIILSMVIACSAVAGLAQTMNIQTGQITTAVNAGQAGDMTYETYMSDFCSPKGMKRVAPCTYLQ